MQEEEWEETDGNMVETINKDGNGSSMKSDETNFGSKVGIVTSLTTAYVSKAYHH